MLLATLVFSVGCEKRTIIPIGTDLFRPVIENDKCVFLDNDYKSEYAGDTKLSSTQIVYKGVVTKIIECPYNRLPEPVKFALIKTDNQEFLWVKLSEL